MLDFINSLIGSLLSTFEYFVDFLMYGPFAFLFGLIMVLVIINLFIRLVKLK